LAKLTSTNLLGFQREKHAAKATQIKRHVHKTATSNAAPNSQRVHDVVSMIDGKIERARKEQLIIRKGDQSVLKVSEYKKTC
jgi:hypothetical protein